MRPPGDPGRHRGQTGEGRGVLLPGAGNHRHLPRGSDGAPLQQDDLRGLWLPALPPCR
jgi:hypothetical protein